MPLQATSGAASYDAFGGGVPVVPNYIEDLFSTYLYSGTGVAQTITNGIDVSTKGGLVWIKARNVAGEPHVLVDSARGATRALRTSGTDAEVNDAGRVSAFTTSGFTIGTDGEVNGTGNTHASWTFRKQPKFFDCVTYTGDGSTNRSIAHNLQSMPGFVIIKRTDSTSNWYVAARLANTDFVVSTWTTPTFFALNSSGAAPNDSPATNVATDSVFYLKMGGDATASVDYTNINGASYVAYLFAHNAGGFGLTGTDNVISCGSFTTNASGYATVDLGYEPQWILYKRSSAGGVSWAIVDSMRGMTANYGTDKQLFANTTAAEVENNEIGPTSTGFTTQPPTGQALFASSTYVYIAIRRGPMKVPTDATKVFAPVLGRSANPNYLSGFPVDLGISEYRVNGSNSTGSRLQGSYSMNTAATSAEANDGSLSWDFMNGYYIGGRTTDFVSWMFRRSPSFCDVACYTGTGSARTVTHNLGAVPELMIVKSRSNTANWPVYASASGATNGAFLDDTSGFSSRTTFWNSTAPTSSVFTVGTSGQVNDNNVTYVAYLFASTPGVSKVGSYTGNGSTQTIDCGFTGGVRFVLIKRTDTTGDWYVYDTARGMTTLTDPYLTLNSTTAEAATLGSVTTVSTGFALNSTILAAINVSGGTYIFLAIA